MQLNIDTTQTTTNIPDCMKLHELQCTASEDERLQYLIEDILQGWPENRDQIPQDMRTYWTFPDYIAVTDMVIITEGI